MTKAAELAKMGEVLTSSQIGGRRNIIINGAMQVAQRGTSFNYTTTDAYSLDRFRIDVTGGDNSAGAFTLTQAAVTDLPGFTKAMKFDVTTADTSIAAGEALNLSYRIEGQDLQQLKKGTSEAEKFTISFYVKGTAKTYALEILDIDNNRMNHQTFGVTTSWNRVVLTFDGDTTGALDNNNERSLDLNFWFHAGSTYAGGTMATGWGTSSGTNANRAAGIGSLYSSTDNELFITGLQMEVGSQATPFEHRSFGEELALCQRYFETLPSGGKVQFGPNSNSNFSSYSNANVIFKVEKRANPTVTATSSGNSNNAINSYSTAAISTWGFIGSGNAQANDAFFLSAFTADSEL